MKYLIIVLSLIFLVAIINIMVSNNIWSGKKLSEGFDIYDTNKISNSLFTPSSSIGENNIDNMRDTLIVAVDNVENDIYFFTVKSIPTLDYGDFKQKIDNHEYRIVNPVTDTNPLTKLLYDNEKHATHLNLMGTNYPDSNITKLDLVTGIPEIVVYDSPEYKFITNIMKMINNPNDTKTALSINNSELAPYQFNQNADSIPPMHDIFIKIGKN